MHKKEKKKKKQVSNTVTPRVSFIAIHFYFGDDSILVIF